MFNNFWVFHCIRWNNIFFISCEIKTALILVPIQMLPINIRISKCGVVYLLNTFLWVKSNTQVLSFVERVFASARPWSLAWLYGLHYRHLLESFTCLEWRFPIKYFLILCWWLDGAILPLVSKICLLFCMGITRHFNWTSCNI